MNNDSLAALTKDILHTAHGEKNISDSQLRTLAVQHGVSLLTAQQSACLAGILPNRYTRNATSLTPQQQYLLLKAHVLLVGLGGLGGTVLELLARMGVGQITGIDGDVFEESNCNRQLLATHNTLNHPKAHAAQERVHAINDAIICHCHTCFLNADTMPSFMTDAHIVVDALGGLNDRLPLQHAAAQAGLPLVSAGIAGFSGWSAVIMPGQTSPIAMLGNDTPNHTSPEERLGNLAPTVMTAASFQTMNVLKLLTQQPLENTTLFFDLSDMTFEHVTL